MRLRVTVSKTKLRDSSKPTSQYFLNTDVSSQSEFESSNFWFLEADVINMLRKHVIAKYYRAVRKKNIQENIQEIFGDRLQVNLRMLGLGS